jgi:putative phosphonate transport system ATP-binding protein
MTRTDAALTVRGLGKRFGPGCPICVDGPPEANFDPLDEEARARGNLCRACGTIHALRDVGFTLHHGEVIGIVGESGSGKSTLLDCLTFDLLPDAGAMHLSGFEGGRVNAFTASAQTRRRLRREQVGRVYQHAARGLRMHVSAVGNVAETMIDAGDRHVGRMRARSEALLQATRIPTHRSAETPARFSGGMQQRVQIAKALANDPSVLLLDEVTTGLDLSVQARVLDLIVRIQRDAGIAMVLVSHDLGVVRMLAERPLVMLSGRIVEAGLTDQVIDDPQHPYTQELVHSLP